MIVELLRKAPTVRKLFADGGCGGPVMDAHLEAMGLSGLIEVVPKPKGGEGFKVAPRRWVVERTFAWMGRCRRLAKDWERTLESSLGWLQMAACRFLMRWLGRALKARRQAANAA